MIIYALTVMIARYQLRKGISKGTIAAITKAWNQIHLRGFNQVNRRQKFNQQSYIKRKINKKTITFKLKTNKLNSQCKTTYPQLKIFSRKPSTSKNS